MIRRLIVACCLLLVASGAFAQCVGGSCGGVRVQWGGRLGQGRVEVRREKTVVRHAWRYVQPSGHRAAIVRIGCETSHGRVYGSGVLVRYRGHLVVLTARHVIRGALKIAVRLVTGRGHRATVVKVDSAWDCAVLKLEGTVTGVEPAEIEYGEPAKQQKGDKLESAGYGPDDKLAVNDGVFIDYRRSTATPNGPDDWLVISGQARQGDSGGPVFNSRGRVVGILWGTDGKSVVCVQAGRIHAVLDEAVSLPVEQYRQHAQFGPMIPSIRPPKRFPTPPAESDGCPTGDCPTGDCPSTGDVATQVDATVNRYLLPFRKDMSEQQAETRRQLDALTGQLNSLSDAIRNAPSQASPASPVPPPKESPKDESAGGPKTIVGKIADREAGWLAEHGGPISSRIAARAEENLESDSAAVRFKGFTQAKVAMLVFFGGILVIGAAVVFLIHRLNDRLLPKLQAMAEKTPNTIDDRLVGLLTKVHDRVDTLEDRVRSRVVRGVASTIPGAAPVVAGVETAQAVAEAVKPIA